MAALEDWLLDSDPTLRWQVERDLLDLPPGVWQATRARVATEGFGAGLLARQDPDGQWAGGAFFPADFTRARYEAEGQPWTATTWTLTALRQWGCDPAALGDTADRLARGCRWEYQDRPYWEGEVDCCINGWTLANGAWLGADVSGIAGWFVDHQLPDGGWNCEWVEGSTRSSFHSTLNSLEGLLAWEVATGGTDATRRARHRAEAYLLERALLFRASTGEPVGPWVDQFTYPGRWRYSALRATDHFRRASTVEGIAPDPRLGPAIDLIRAARQPDGTWTQGPRLGGEAWFEVDVPPGEPSPWLTLFALRVLRWFAPT